MNKVGFCRLFAISMLSKGQVLDREFALKQCVIRYLFETFSIVHSLTSAVKISLPKDGREPNEPEDRGAQRRERCLVLGSDWLGLGPQK